MALDSNKSAKGSGKTKNNISVSDSVFWGVVRGLEAREYVPGQRLVETDLMAKYSAGRSSVRGAIQRLAAEGIVDLMPNKGAVVRLMTQYEMLDLLDIVERIFGLLARQAVRGVDDADNRQMLQDSMALLEQTYKDNDFVALARARRRFYKILLDMGNSSDVKRIFTTLHIAIIYAQRQIPSLYDLRVSDYRLIAKTVLAGDPDAAELAGAQHVKNVRHALVELIKEKQDERD